MVSVDELEIEVLRNNSNVQEENAKIWETFNKVLDFLSDVRKDIASLRTDVDKLIENNNGGKYGKSA